LKHGGRKNEKNERTKKTKERKKTKRTKTRTFLRVKHIQAHPQQKSGAFQFGGDAVDRRQTGYLFGVGHDQGVVVLNDGVVLKQAFFLVVGCGCIGRSSKVEHWKKKRVSIVERSWSWKTQPPKREKTPTKIARITTISNFQLPTSKVIRSLYSLIDPPKFHKE